ncbi:rRNA small subunit methyltransferase B [Phycicoccus endophyticus]|uniref:rRNA small subunit methyltransferase B n=1 Tax=Phycicoccus endophyticus TaxID=1690220 RepID=A0A7G9R498_9MICO|nr:transcription antitermination factor NusB [Phycicoccus endophyticus]NHI18283.1 rRNA small subunit methyltransferase B [Phycicoccus endophyticus]QNN50423.1 rRNA small subunit methyltransferase B [Phycicoccus endophyticus]GGL25015.1 rRNA cytosine-C5-methyltransferase [Phycicoccus endophyticus]
MPDRPSRSHGGGPRRRSRTAPSERTRRAEPTRFAAYTLLRAVADGAYANLEMPRILRRRRLEGRDAAFATELAFGTVRWQGLYDRIVAVAADRPVERIDPPVLDVLRLGVHQLVGMRVPAHAAADQTVGLARAVVGQGASGLVNAVLRRVGERDLEEWTDAVTPEGGGVAALAVRHSHPEWVVTALRAALLGHGRATPDTVDAELAALLAADNAPPQVHLVARPGLATVDELVAAADAEPSATSPIGVVLRGGDPGRVAAVRDGRAAVQDEGSQHLALALAAVEVADGLPTRWLDLCAGPGGKAGVLGGLALEHGADLTAVEVSPHRADLVRSSLGSLAERAEAVGRSVEVRTADGRELGAEEPGRYARVLVDAPCTGLGALRRRPEARWRRQPSDLATLGPLQRALLASALDAAAPGGVVAYATCSPHVAETRFVVADVLKKRDDVEVLDARPSLRDAHGEQLPELGDGPHVQLWPHVHGTDAMFLALLRKRAAR